MKKSLIKVLVSMGMIMLILLLPSLAGINASLSDFAFGIGSKSDPYVIKTSDQLAYLAQQVNMGNTYKDKYFVLENDIYLNDESFVFNCDTGLVRVSDGKNIAYLGTGIKGDESRDNSVFDSIPSQVGVWYASDTSKNQGSYAGDISIWTPIGNSLARFEGNFDGQGYIISGLYINTTLDYGGLFGCAHATIKNIGVDNSYVSSGEFAGAIAGTNLGSTQGCRVNAVVCSDKNYVGAIIGKGGSVFECVSEGYVRADQYAGGISGSSNAQRCSNLADVVANKYAGGIVGMGRVSDCVNSADVSGVECIGGICGTINDQSIKTSYNIGKVFGEKYVGAILGRAVTGDVINSYYLADCASDSSGKLQNGVGASSTGSSRSDKKGSTTALEGEQLNQIDSFAGFDFESVWYMDISPILIFLKGESHVHEYDNECDAVCNICGQSRVVEGHKYSSIWSYDNEGHWYVCRCGDKKSFSKHRYDNSCDTVCNDCAFVRITSHSYKEEWSSDDSMHWRICTVCAHRSDLGAHQADKSGRICKICAYVMYKEPDHEHKYSDKWSYDDSSHWHACECADKSEIQKHVFDNDCDESCAVCTYKRSTEHSYTVRYNEKSHWRECVACGSVDDSELHYYDGLCDTTCNMCEYERKITHIYGEWISDETTHAGRCVLCNAEGESSEHRFDEGSVSVEPTVDKEGVKAYKCTVCSFEKHEAIPRLQGSDQSSDDNTSKPQISDLAGTDDYDDDEKDPYLIPFVVFCSLSCVLLAVLVIVIIWAIKKKK